MKSKLIIPEEVVLNKIYFFREQKVILDSDLAELYGVETKVLKQAVKRNLDIFPAHFMFVLTDKEYLTLRSQIVTSKNGRVSALKQLLNTPNPPRKMIGFKK